MTAVCRMQMGCGDGYLGIRSSWAGSRQERRPGDGDGGRGGYKDVVVAGSGKDRKHPDSHPHLHQNNHLPLFPFSLDRFPIVHFLPVLHSYPNHPNKPNTPILNMSSYLEQNLSFYTVRHLPPLPPHLTHLQPSLTPPRPRFPRPSPLLWSPTPTESPSLAATTTWPSNPPPPRPPPPPFHPPPN